MDKKVECNKFHKFIRDNKIFLDNPIIKNFLSIKENYYLLKQCICDPTPQNQDLLDQNFRDFFFHTRFTSYVSTTLHFHGINLDKRYRETRNRYPLLLDQPVNDDTSISFKDLAEQHESFEIESDDLLDYILDFNLFKALQEITSNQRRILSLVYIKGYTDTEVGLIMNKSQQAISKSRKKALNRLRKYLEETRSE